MKTLILPFIHFAALVAFIVYKTKSPFKQFIQTRHTDVVTGLNKSKTQAAEAAQRKAEIEKRFMGLDAERAQIITEWKEREVQQIRGIRESTERTITQLKADAELNKKSLVETFQKETARNIGILVISKAEEKMKASMNSELHQKMNAKVVQGLLGA
jgi:F0F1-type ATP synthase membrane subunit b/b'